MRNIMLDVFWLLCAMTADDPAPAVSDTLLTKHGLMINKRSTAPCNLNEFEDCRSWFSSVVLFLVTILVVTAAALHLTPISMTKHQIPASMSILSLLDRYIINPQNRPIFPPDHGSLQSDSLLTEFSLLLFTNVSFFLNQLFIGTTRTILGHESAIKFRKSQST